MDKPLIEVRDLTKHYAVTEGLLVPKVVGQVKAVDGVSFTIGKGRTLGLVGESGCGKSTTSKILLRLIQQTSGDVLLADGSDVQKLKGSALSDYRRSVQAVFQDPWSSLNPRMRVRHIISEALRATARPPRAEVDARVREVMEQVGLNPDMADRFPHEFSGGQRQRIAVAAALASSPKLIVLDEPVSALDVSIGAQVMNLFKDLQASQGIAFLLIAHNLATVRYMAHDTAVMYLGKIVEYGPTETVFGRASHPYTKALMSASLSADPDAGDNEIVLKGETPSPINPPSGCHFHTRCPFAMDRCKAEVPALKEAESGYKVACHLV